MLLSTTSSRKHGADLEIQNAAAQTPLDVAGVHMGARGKDAFKSWFETAIAAEKKKRTPHEEVV